MSKLFNFAQPKGKWHKFTSFNLGGAKLYKNFVQKLLAVSLCMAMVLLGVPRGQNFVAEAADEAIPNTLFITKKDLLALCEETNGGKGMLATGTDTDVKLRINFGQRPENVKYYKDSSWWPIYTAAAGPTTWLVAGSEKFTPAGGTETDGLVLYSEEPLVSENTLRDASSKMNSKFQPTHTDKIDGACWVGSDTTKTAFDDSWGAYPSGSEPSHVYENHWGASNLRRVLTAIYNGSTLGEGDETADSSGFFNATEKGLMAASVIKTNDHQTGLAVEYTTTDVLYAPRYDSNQMLRSWEITVGGADSLTIVHAYWAGISWLRSPSPINSSRALVALPGVSVLIHDVLRATPSISAAFRLNLSSVLFASAASAASSAEGGKFEKISTDTPMTLRLKAPEGSTAEVSATDDGIVTKNAAGWTLMVQGVTRDGQNWSYSKAIDTDADVPVTAAEVAEAGSIELENFEGCTVWLEKPVEDGGLLAYATQPVTVKPPIETTVKVRDGQTQRIRLYDPYAVLPSAVEFSAKYNKLSAGTPNFIIQVSPVLHAYDLTLTSGGKELSQLDAPVTLRFEAVRGIDAADAAVTRLVNGASTDLEVSRVIDDDGTVWVEITTDHFSRYILVTGRRAARILLAGIATLLILALGFTIRFLRKKKKN